MEREKEHLKIRLLKCVIIYAVTLFIFYSLLTIVNGYAAEAVPYNGVPKVTLNINDLDNTGNLIYCGIDIAVFWDKDNDGKYVVYPDDKKVKRIITTKTKITIDPGPISTFKKGKKYKLAMRTLYVPTGTKQEPIVIADFNNGKEGWNEIPGTLFVPSYFINPIDNPYILHTSKWQQNLNTYNQIKTENAQLSKIRANSVFWSGEKFMLHVETAEEVKAVAVSIIDEKNEKGKPYKVILTEHSPHTNVSGAAIYEGELWDESMFNKWGNYIPKELTFKLEILDLSDEVLEEKNVPVIIDNRELFYRNTKKY